MSPIIRHLLLKITPKFIRDIRNTRIERNMQQQRDAESQLFTMVNGEIISGPFKGLKYCDQACGSMLGPKLLGVYEAEIQNIVHSIIKTNYSHIIDIGAAEGYYAIGLLRSCPSVTVTAFETSPDGRRSLRDMANQNSVSNRLIILGHCEADGLRESLRGSKHELIICDVEGGEIHLLHPIVNQEIINCDILVEVHDFVNISISTTLLKRFSATHDITRIRTKPRGYNDLPRISGLSKYQLLLLASERRRCSMEWFWMRTKSPID